MAIRLAVMGVDDAGIYAYSPYPGSELYNYLRSTGAIPQMDRDYFTSLMTFMDLKQSSNYCENVGAMEISTYRLIGMCAFYGLTYLLRPASIARTIRNYRTHKSDTIFEERLFALLRRKNLERRAAEEGPQEIAAKMLVANDEALVLSRDESFHSIEERLRFPIRRELCVSEWPIQANQGTET